MIGWLIHAIIETLLSILLVFNPFEKVEEDTDRNYWLSAKEAMDYGLVSKIIATHSELEY